MEEFTIGNNGKSRRKGVIVNIVSNETIPVCIFSPRVSTGDSVHEEGGRSTFIWKSTRRLLHSTAIHSRTPLESHAMAHNGCNVVSCNRH
jgi:hypothetical protein